MTLYKIDNFDIAGDRYTYAARKLFKDDLNQLHTAEISATIFGKSGISYGRNDIDEVFAISPEGYPLLKFFKHLTSKLFENCAKVKKMYRPGYAGLTKHQKDVRVYVRNMTSLAFILPNGRFIFTEYNETLNDVARRVLYEYPELMPEFKSWKSSGTSDMPEAEFLVRVEHSIAFYKCSALISNEKPLFRNRLLEMWKYTLLFTRFFPHIEELIVVEF